MNNRILHINGWWDDDDPEALVYFEIREDDKVIWMSSWHDVREFCEDRTTTNDLREEVSYPPIN